MSLQNQSKVCLVCQRSENSRPWGADFHADSTWSSGVCLDCFREFVGDCLEPWLEQQRIRRAEFAYDLEFDYGGPSHCDRCGDENGWTGGCAAEIVFPDGERLNLCNGCYHRDWVDLTSGQCYDIPAEVWRQFQRRGVGSYHSRLERKMKEMGK